MSEAKKPAVLPRPTRLPLLAVRDVVVFPHMVLPLSVGRPKSVKSIEAAMKDHLKFLCVVAQKDVTIEDPKPEEVFNLGVLVEVVQYLKMPDGTLKVFLQAHARASVKAMEYDVDAGHWSAALSYPETPGKPGAETRALMRHALEVGEEHAKFARRAPAELPALASIEDPSELAQPDGVHRDPIELAIHRRDERDHVGLAGLAKCVKRPSGIFSTAP